MKRELEVNFAILLIYLKDYRSVSKSGQQSFDKLGTQGRLNNYPPILHLSRIFNEKSQATNAFIKLKLLNKL